MGTRSRADAKHMYSWWWDSHISPKNSKWLKESLKDMDNKVKHMIELVEVDKDSFASRAEMYYENRPQLMQLLEDFYRGYRALAERYDHASGAIKQAHKSITEVFPNQVPPLSDDVPSSPSHSYLPEKPVATQESHDLQELDYGDVNGNEPFGPVEATSPSRLGGLDYHDAFIGALKKAFGRAVQEKEAAEIQYQKYLEKIASLESEIVRLKDEVDQGTVKFKVSEEQCVLLEKSNESMRGELDLFSTKLDAQNKELEEKQKEIGRLCTCLQEAETALKDEVSNITQRKEELEEETNTLQEEIHRLRGLQDENAKLKESYQLIKNEKSAVVVEKSVLLNERQAMKLKLCNAQDKLEELGKIHEELERKYNVLEEQRESEETKNKISLLQDANDHTRKQLEEEQDKAANSQLEILSLKNTLHDLKETNSSLLKNYEKLMETSEVSEKLITDLEHKNTEQDVELNFLSEKISRMRMGMLQLLKALDVDHQFAHEIESDDDELILQRMLVKFDAARNSLVRAWDENRTLVIEKSILQALLGELKQEVADLKALISSMKEEFSVGSDRLSSLHGDIQKLLRSHEELIPKVTQKNHKEEFSEEKLELEHENSCLVAEVVSLDMLSLILRRLLEEKVRIMENMSNAEGAFLLELQSYSVREVFFKEKLSELIGEYDRVEEESRSKGLKVLDLRERVGSLESQSGQLRAQLTGYLPALRSLQESLASLQDHATNDHGKGTENPNKDAASDGVSDLQDIAAKIKSVANAFIATKRLRHKNESTELLMKDIELDQASETVEKDLEVDRETPGSDRKLPEGPDSDVHKLSELQRKVQGLKERVALAENKGNEYVQVKEHLEDTDKAITKLMDTSTSVSEKTGRLQVEVEKIRDILTKTDDVSMAEKKMDVALKDYLYGGDHRSARKKRDYFCACIRSSNGRD